VPIDPAAGGKPIWMQLADILRDELGKMPSGRMLPSVRTLMQTYEVADGTVKHALAQLREEGLIVTYAGKGSYKV
jgi:GntR family transcriptional regulator